MFSTFFYSTFPTHIYLLFVYSLSLSLALNGHEIAWVRCIMLRLTLAITAWLALGLPLYYFTLNVDRAQLDYAVLEKYDELAKSSIGAAIKIGVWCEDIPDLAPATQYFLNKNLWKWPSLDLQNSNLLYTPSFIVENECSAETELCVHAQYGDSDTVKFSSNSNELEVTFGDETMANARIPELVAVLLFNNVYNQVLSNEGIGNSLAGGEKLPAVTINYSPSLHLTFSLFSEGGEIIHWPAKQAIVRHLQALFDELSSEVVQLSVDTQTALYAKPQFELQDRQLKRSELTNFVDFAEWPLASLSQEPTLQFVLYVPSEPLDVLDSKTNSFIIPQWGGVVIMPPLGDEHKLTIHELEHTMVVCARQLLVLLGMREPTREDHNGKPPLEVRLADLARKNSIRGLKEAAASVGSLQRLAASMPDIPIPKKVSARVNEAIEAIENGLRALDAANLKDAREYAAQAYTAAERAFFNKDMVAQAYFPDEHKLAVYMPLIGPMLVVVLGGWMRTIKELKQKKKTETTEEKKEEKIEEKTEEKK